MIFARIKHILALLIIISSLWGCKAAKSFQDDADIIRLQHLKYYGELLDEYKNKTGYYPFSGQKIANYVFITHDRQSQNQELPFTHRKVSFLEFITEIEETLEREVDEFFDPQYAPDYKPNFYIYMAQNEKFYLAVHLSKSYPFTKKISDGYHKVEISNVLDEKNKFYTIQSLKESHVFNKEIQKTPKKSEFFKERENLYKNFTKTPQKK